MIIHGSLSHDASGRKKRTARKGSFKRVQSSGTFKPDYTYRRGRTDHIPSLMTNTCSTTVDKDQAVKQEVSSKYTVAVAYNKGAYQVIPASSVKDIGK